MSTMLETRNQLVAVILSTIRSNTRAQRCIIIAITFHVILAIFSVSATHTKHNDTNHLVFATKEAPPVSWHYIHTNHPKIDNLIADTCDGSILVASKGTIFRYTKELELNGTSAIGNPNTQRINKVLTLLDDGNRLMSCGQLNEKTNLNCVLHNLNDLTSTRTQLLSWTSQLFNKSDIVFKSDPNEQISAHKLSNNHMLMVTRRGEDGFKSKQLEQVFGTGSSSSARLPHYVPAMAKYEIIRRTNQLNMTALLPYQLQARIGNRTFAPLYDYLYTFTHESFTYFVLNNIEGAAYEPRLARICNNDTKLTSYTEVGIVCGGPTVALVGLRATVAYFDRQDSTLHVVLERPITTDENLHLCSYAMKKVQGAFGRAVKNCYNGHAPSSLLAKLHAPGSSLVCRRSPAPQQLQECCTSTLNPYIDGHYNKSHVEHELYFTLEGWKDANFLLALTQNNERVYFIGSDSFWLTKVSARAGGPVFVINLAKHRVGVYPLERERIEFAGYQADEEDEDETTTQYTYARGHITAINSKSEIHQLPVDSCQYYTTCYSCHTVQDPLKCIWCGDKCERRTNCNQLGVHTNNETTCPPTIYAFSPRAGPTGGQNTLVILGDGFGGQSSRLTVTVGGEECPIDELKSSGNRIECSLFSASEPHEALISVTVQSSVSNGVRLEGNVTSPAPYEYKQVSVFGIAHPASGPSEGGTEISIEGENLDVCRSRSVKLGEISCEIVRVESARIVCKTGPFDSMASHTAAAETFPLQVLLDEIWPIAHKPHETLSQVFHYYQLNRATPWTWSSLLTISNLFWGLATLTPLVLLTTWLLIFRKHGKQIDGAEEIVTRTPAVGTRSLSPTSTEGSTTRPNSLTGLIKLDGAAMSGNYFAPNLLEDKIPDSSLSDKMRSLLGRENILIDRNRLTLGHLLGAGQFARVYKGYLRPDASQGIGEYTPVAVKTQHDRPSCTNKATDGEEFLEEGLIMRDFAHENVLGLIGVAFNANGMPMVITPFMLYGDLKSYVCDGEFSPSTEELVGFGVQIARGMAYLANLKFVHRDLAARNCMLNELKVVKVADFGLSRDIYAHDYYSSESRGAKLPVKWMAIESLGESLYSTKSDVWSYGVLLWELLAPQPGLVPYSDVDNFDILNYLRAGRRLSQPRNCPASLYGIMQACWQADPSARPTFEELVKCVSAVLNRPNDGGGKTLAEHGPAEQFQSVVEPPVASRRPSRISLPEVSSNVSELPQRQLKPDERVEVRQTSAEIKHVPMLEQDNANHPSAATHETNIEKPVQCSMSMQARQEKTHSIDLSQMTLAEQARYLGVAFDGFCFDRLEEDDEATSSQE